MLEKAKRFLPGLDTRGGREWMGFRPSLPDSLPVIGRSKHQANVFYAFGHGHLGLTQAAATGRLIRDAHPGASSGDRPVTLFRTAVLNGARAQWRGIPSLCIDGHTCGNPVRLVAGGGPLLNGATMMERRAHFLAEYDWIRTGLMFEPRGHDVMSGSILYPPTREDCDIAILFIETSGCLPMCGHGTIGTVTMAIEHGLVKPRTPGVLRLDTPAGLVIAEYRQEGEHVEEVRITNVPSFLYAEGLAVECPALGEIKVDVAYGGNFYAIVEPQENYRDMADHPVGGSDRLEPGAAISG